MREREGARNGRRRHHQHIGLGGIIRLGGVGLLHQAEALHHAEAMLLVDDDQAELVELDRLLDERVRADHQLCVALRDVMSRLLLAARLLRSGEQYDAIAGGFENAARRKIMLRRENFRGRHQRDLVAVLDGDDRCFERDNGFARADIALQQTAHGRGLGHVGGNFFQHALLRRRGMKRQDALHGGAHAVVDLERDAGLRAHLAALQFESEFEEEQFFEDQPDVRGRARRLQVRQALANLGPVRLPEGATAIDQLHAATNGGRNRVGNILVEVLQHAVDDAAKPARGEAAVAGGFVDRNDAADFERLPLLIFGGGFRLAEGSCRISNCGCRIWKRWPPRSPASTLP